MSSNIKNGVTFHGISVFGLGVSLDDEDDEEGVLIYAGQHKDGYACGLGVRTWASCGNKDYAEYGPDGEYDGRWMYRWVDGYTSYGLYERGEGKDWACVYVDGRCFYNGEACVLDDPRLLALIAQVAPVEVRLAAPDRRPQSSATHSQGIGRSVCPRRRSRTPWPPRCTPHAARRPWWPCDTTQQQPQCKARRATTR